MKKILLCLLLLTACKPSSYFISANQVKKKEVVLFLKNQVKARGEIYIDFESQFRANPYPQAVIKFIPEGKNLPENINLNDIVGYSKGTDFFALKKIDLNLDQIHRLLFVKRLTSGDSKIQFYELYESGLANFSGNPAYSYYLALPSFEPLQTMNIGSDSLFPFFDQKMSRMVSDCPALAEKIRSKQKGYFLPQISFENNKRRDVVFKIINEYNQCQ